MGLDVNRYPPYKYTEVNGAYTRTGFWESDQSLDEADRYELALDFWDRLISESASRGLTIPSRLYAQSVMWQLQNPEIWNGPDRVPSEHRDATG